MSRRQFTLFELLIFVSLSCVLAATMHWLGLIHFLVVLALFAAFLVVTMGWAAIYLVAPQATKYFTVIGLCGTMILSLLSMAILHAREDARRNECLRRIRIFGEEKAMEYEAHFLIGSPSTGQRGAVSSSASKVDPAFPPTPRSSAANRP
jgi:hypothetical protein